MYTRYYTLIFLVLFSLVGTAQDYAVEGFPKLGDVNQAALDLASYELEPSAPAVVLFEKGSYTYELLQGLVRVKKTVRRRVKVFNSIEYDGANITIRLYDDGKYSERLSRFDGVVTNGSEKSEVGDEGMFLVDDGERIEEHRIALPNVKDGSVIDYEYVVISPYLSYLDDWDFQSTIPKIYSEFVTSIPGNYNYRTALYGNLKLSKNERDIKRECLVIPGFRKAADCKISVYAMENIPSLTVEDYMLSIENYRSKISLDLQDLLKFDGSRVNYSETWEDVDTRFKKSRSVGGELNLDRFFSKSLPEDLMTAGATLENAKAIYAYVQNRYAWNGEYRVFSDIDVKNAFKEKKGNVAEINLGLVNALAAAGFDAKVLMTSTRARKLPGTVYPVLSNFTYTQAFVEIDGIKYVLDATDKLLPFGMLPYKTLIGDGRVLDFKNGSYWTPVRRKFRNIFFANADLRITDNLTLEGTVKEKYAGYLGYTERKNGLDKGSLSSYRNLSEVEIEIRNSSNQYDLDKPIAYELDFSLEAEEIGNSVYFNPLAAFRVDHGSEFTKETRQYPIDFGFGFTEMYLAKITIPDNYIIESIPENIAINSADGKVSLKAVFSKSNGVIQTRITLVVGKYYFLTDEYPAIKSVWERYNELLNSSVVKISPHL